jgi:hypothetical protein
LNFIPKTTAKEAAVDFKERQIIEVDVYNQKVDPLKIEKTEAFSDMQFFMDQSNYLNF